MKIMILAAHPDDEVLGCGGTMALHAEAGDEVHVVFLTDGVGARGKKGGSAAITQRKEAAERAGGILGVSETTFLEFPDNAMDSVPQLEVNRAVEERIEAIGPTVIYTHHPGDLNVDHRVAHEAVMTACRPQPGSNVAAIFCFEVLSSTGWSSPSMGKPFVPQYFVEITNFMDQKIRALEAYAEEMRDPPHARSIEAARALAVTRGHGAGVDLAEAFTVEREILFGD